MAAVKEMSEKGFNNYTREQLEEARDNIDTALAYAYSTGKVIHSYINEDKVIEEVLLKMKIDKALEIDQDIAEIEEYYKKMDKIMKEEYGLDTEKMTTEEKLKKIQEFANEKNFEISNYIWTQIQNDPNWIALREEQKKEIIK